MPTPRPNKRLWSGWYTAILIVAGLIFAVIELPENYSNDLSVIGTGKNVIVVIHDRKKFQSVDFLSQLNSLRDEYQGRITFCVADIKDKKGAEFAQEQQVTPPSLLLFAADGRRLGVIKASRSPEAVSAAIKQMFQL